MEALAYDYLTELNPPNIMRLTPHPAVAFGLGSRPSTAALVGGMLPVCQIPNCYHRDIRYAWSNPFFLTATRKTTEHQFFLCPNGWSLELLLPWMTLEQRKLNMKWHDSHEALPAKEETDYFLATKDKYESYFAYIHYFESHPPYYSPKGHDRKEAVLFLDEQVGRILDASRNDERIVVCSDHNLPPGKVSAAMDVPSPVTMLSFICSNFKQPIPWNIDSHQIARDAWTN